MQSGQVAPAVSQALRRSMVTYMPKPGDGDIRTVTLIPGDGIGPEMTGATPHALISTRAWIIPLVYGSKASAGGYILRMLKTDRHNTRPRSASMILPVG